MQEEVFKTLANQKRLEILQLLNQKELSVTEMVDMLGVNQANLSQHLSLLRKLRLVSTRKDGLHVYYRLSDKRIAAVINQLREFLKVQYVHEPEIAEIRVLGKKSLYPIVRDPVCKMRLSVSEALESCRRDNKVYYFCASGCKEKFVKKPTTVSTVRL